MLMLQRVTMSCPLSQSMPFTSIRIPWRSVKERPAPSSRHSMPPDRLPFRFRISFRYRQNRLNDFIFVSPGREIPVAGIFVQHEDIVEFEEDVHALVRCLFDTGSKDQNLILMIAASRMVFAGPMQASPAVGSITGITAVSLSYRRAEIRSLRTCCLPLPP